MSYTDPAEFIRAPQQLSRAKAVMQELLPLKGRWIKVTTYGKPLYGIVKELTYGTFGCNIALRPFYSHRYLYVDPTDPLCDDVRYVLEEDGTFYYTTQKASDLVAVNEADLAMLVLSFQQ